MTGGRAAARRRHPGAPRVEAAVPGGTPRLRHQVAVGHGVAHGDHAPTHIAQQVADTARARGITEAEVVRDVMLAAQPTKKFIQIDEIAELVLYLCSDAAASITGAILPVDGGWSAQ